MKHRLLVMNGRRVLEAEESGEWKVQKVAPAGGLRPGIYNLYAATAAVEGKTYAGVILHADKDHVYQQAPGGLVQFPRSAFSRPPEVGTAQTVVLRQGVAQVEAGQTLARGLKR